VKLTLNGESVTGQNGSGQDDADIMVAGKVILDKMVLDKGVRTNWHEQNGTDKMVQIKWHRSIQFLFSNQVKAELYRHKRKPKKSKWKRDC